MLLLLVSRRVIFWTQQMELGGGFFGEHIFRMGWFNHQLAEVWFRWFSFSIGWFWSSTRWFSRVERSKDWGRFLGPETLSRTFFTFCREYTNHRWIIFLRFPGTISYKKTQPPRFPWKNEGVISNPPRFFHAFWASMISGTPNFQKWASGWIPSIPLSGCSRYICLDENH